MNLRAVCDAGPSRLLQMSPRSHDPCERHQEVVRLHAVCHEAVPPRDLRGSVAVQVHLPLPRGLQGAPLRDHAGRLPRGRGPELQLALRHLHLLHGFTR